MTLDECRDRIAELLGWKRELVSAAVVINGFQPTYTAWVRPGENTLGAKQDFHPVPATIDGIAALMPKDFIVCIQQDESIENLWVGAVKKRSAAWAHEAEGRDEITCRTRLLLAVLEAERKPR